jgi:hypothetical protein
MDGIICGTSTTIRFMKFELSLFLGVLDAQA